jgi:hypothetical protein
MRLNEDDFMNELEQIYEAVAGYDAIDSYTHEEILLLIKDMNYSDQLIQEATSDEYLDLVNRRENV